MWKQIACASLVIGATCLVLPRADANKNFVPDWTFQGSSLGAARTVGSADWRAENGERVDIEGAQVRPTARTNHRGK